MSELYTVTEFSVEEREDPSPWCLVFKTFEDAVEAIRDDLATLVIECVMDDQDLFEADAKEHALKIVDKDLHIEDAYEYVNGEGQQITSPYREVHYDMTKFIVTKVSVPE